MLRFTSFSIYVNMHTINRESVKERKYTLVLKALYEYLLILEKYMRLRYIWRLYSLLQLHGVLYNISS